MYSKEDKPIVCLKAAFAQVDKKASRTSFGDINFCVLSGISNKTLLMSDFLRASVGNPTLILYVAGI